MGRDGAHIPAVSCGSYPLRGGNAVRPLVDGEPAFRRICEAAEAAEHSLWVTVAFYEPTFRMPDDHGGFFDVLDRAAKRGIDVRVIFWRSAPTHEHMPGAHFFGTEQERAQLAKLSDRLLARWDQAHGAYCQHQKSWLMDAGQPSEVAFVGGINLDSGSVAVPGHPPAPQGNVHDVYVEIQGPAATDVHHNFVQRWNEASDRDRADGRWPATGNDDLPFPAESSSSRGEIPVQVQRIVRAGRYGDATATPDGQPHEIGAGERGVLDQYLQAIDAARQGIYIEDQAIGSPQIVERLQAAADRGVEVVALVPGAPMPGVGRARRSEKGKAFHEAFDRLGDHERFTLAGIAANRGEGRYEDIYVHAKIALIDDLWCTIGSTNLINRSFYGDTELNASLWHGPTVHRLRTELLAEHLGMDTIELSCAAALTRYRDVAEANRRRRDAGEPLQGLAFAIDVRSYGL